MQTLRDDKIHEWMAQARRDAKPELIPAVFHRRSREKWLVTMQAEDFLRLYEANAMLDVPESDK